MTLIKWDKRLDGDHAALRRAGCASVAWKDRFVLIFGGREAATFFLDCWSFDTSSGALQLLSNDKTLACRPSNPRANHTATLVDDVIWIIGGADNETIFGDVWCFHVKSRTWIHPKLT